MKNDEKNASKLALSGTLMAVQAVDLREEYDELWKKVQVFTGQHGGLIGKKQWFYWET